MEILLLSQGTSFTSKFLQQVLLFFAVYCLPLQVSAKSYIVNDLGDTVIGEVHTTYAKVKDTLLDIGRRNGFGYFDMKLANPYVDTWLPEDGQKIVIPSQFVLPHAPRQGIVVNIPEMRMYYYPPNKKNGLQPVVTYPMGIGRDGWNTPYIATKIVEKNKHPEWYPPESIRQEYEAVGDPLPEVVEAGPDNPLGDFAMRLGRRDYLIHGTNRPYGVGMRVSHGCIRLYPEDIEALFQQVTINTPVNIINQPYKVGVKNDAIYLEAHPFLAEDARKFEDSLGIVTGLLVIISGDRDYEIDWAAASSAINNPTGIPVMIGMYTHVDMQAKVEERLRTGLSRVKKIEP